MNISRRRLLEGAVAAGAVLLVSGPAEATDAPAEARREEPEETAAAEAESTVSAAEKPARWRGSGRPPSPKQLARALRGREKTEAEARTAQLGVHERHELVESGPVSSLKLLEQKRDLVLRGSHRSPSSKDFLRGFIRA